MANHLHKQIRDALKTQLTGLASSGARVYANRLQPLPDNLSPTLLITLDEEQATAGTVHAPTLLERELTAVVTAVAKATAGLDDALDQMSQEVEIALSSGIAVGAAMLYPIYSGMSFEDAQGDKPVGVKRMTFSINYLAMNSAPDTLS